MACYVLNCTYTKQLEIVMQELEQQKYLYLLSKNILAASHCLVCLSITNNLNLKT